MLELVVALAIGAAVITAGVLVFQALGGGTQPTGNYVRLPLGTAVMQNFYGTNQATLEVWVAPNYGRRVQADALRDQFWEDIDKASAVFCLGRTAGTLNATHPTTIPISGLVGQSVDLPGAFQAVLESAIPASVGTFTAYRGACLSPNISIFILQPSNDETELSVLAIYDIDMLAAQSEDGVDGTYVSGRRYATGTLTHFYDVFFAREVGTVAFSPLVVAFERAARLSLAEGTIDRLKVAAERPFYFIWWPDPAQSELESVTAGSFDLSDPRSAYANMGGRTSLFFAVPMFPAL